MPWHGIGAALTLSLLAQSAAGQQAAPPATPAAAPDCPAVLGLALAAIPGGAYRIGANPGFDRDERPVHVVNLKPFCVSVHQVTPADLARLKAAVGDVTVGADLSQPEALAAALEGYADLPATPTPAQLRRALLSVQGVEGLPRSGVLDPATRRALDAQSSRLLSKIDTSNVSWMEAVAIAKLYSKATGRRVRLATEAEWEAMARGGLSGRSTPWGNLQDRVSGRRIADIIAERTAGACEGEDGPASPADTPANGFGVRSLLTTWEWTSSVYAPYPYTAADGRESPNPRRGMRAIRGTGGGQESCKISVSFRGYGSMASQYGLRLVVDP